MLWGKVSSYPHGYTKWCVWFGQGLSLQTVSSYNGGEKVCDDTEAENKQMSEQIHIWSLRIEKYHELYVG